MSIIKIPGAVKVAARDSPRRLSPAVLPNPPVRGMARPLAPVSSRAEAPFRPTVPGGILSFHGRIALPKGRSCLKGCPLPSGSSRSRGGRPATSPLVCDIRPGESRDRNEYGPNGRRPGTPFRSRAPLPRFPVAVFPVQSLRPRSFAPQPAFRSPFSQYNRCDLDPSRRSPLSGRRFSSTIVATSILRAAARFPVAVFPAFRPSFRRIVNHIIVFG